jgi:uncharacterized protein YjiS (DUF1127 family)
MMIEMYGERRISPRGDRHDEYRSARRSRSAVATVLFLPFTDPAARRRYEPHTSLQMVISRTIAAIRFRRVRARSRQQLRALSDHLLKDIGLRREDAGYEFPKPFWPCE